MKTRAVFLAAMASMLIASSVAAQSVTLPVVNGGFEQPSTPDDSRNFTTAIPGWTFTAVGGFQDDGVTNPGYNVDHAIDPVCEGDQALIIQEATLEQTVAGGLVAGTCTFEAKIWVTDKHNSINHLRLFAGSHQIVELKPTVDKQWETLSHTFTVDANSNLIGQSLRIEIDQWANPNHLFTYYDAISIVCTPPAPPGTCEPRFASELIAAHQGPHGNAADGPHNALGDDLNTFFHMGLGGWIKVGFGDAYSTSGDSQADICIDESGVTDCYYVKVRPADSATAQALQAAGLQQSGDFYRLGILYCGTTSIDLDAIIPGFGEGDLRFDALKVFDDNDSGSAEIQRIEAKFVCTPPVSDCYPSFAVAVDDSQQGPHAHVDQDASGALGNDTNTRFSAGQGGFIVVNFGEAFSTSGDAQDDLCVDEYNVVDCYYVDVKPADSATEQALIAAGLNLIGDFYDLGPLFCGDENIDIDAIVPGFAEGELRFESVRIYDDGSSGDGFELVRIEAKFVCPEIIVCGPEFASVVLAANQGANAVADDGTAGALGDTPATFWASGVGGDITLGFGNRFSTTGDASADLCVDEEGFADCYFIQLDPSNSLTETALQNAGLMPVGDFYDLGVTYCGDEDIDIDAVIGGFNGEVLSFDAVRLVADVDPVNNNGFELNRLEAKVVCSDAGPDFAKIGDRIWADVDCDGIQDGDEAGVGMVQVDLLDAMGNVVDTTMTDMNGNYVFCVMPGTYSVRIFPDATLFMVTAPSQGGDPELDSDFDQSSQTAGPITVEFGDQRLDIDAGLCVICNVVTAFANNNLPACGLPNDPVMTATVPAFGSIWTLSVDSDFPNVPIFVFYGLGGPVPLSVPGSTCVIYTDLSTLGLLTVDNTDANGDWSISTMIPVMPVLAGFEFTFQSRVCDPSNQGPIPGIPDFPSNASHIGIGCP